MSEENLNVVAYLKTQCGWSGGVRAILAKYNLEYTEKDIIQNPAFRWEMEQKSGQPLSPCVEINGTMLPDVSGEQVEEWLISQGLVEKESGEVGVSINSSCTDAQHEQMARDAMGGGLRFVE